MKKMFAATLSALAISWLSASTALANPVVLNPDFASPSYAVGSQGWAYLGPAAPATATVNDWTYSGEVGNALDNGVWFAATPPVGQQAAFFQRGTISQTISGFTPGNLYNITFYLAQRPGGYPANPIDVTAGSTDIGTYTPTSTTIFQQFTTTNFLATASSVVLTFSANPPSCATYSVSCDYGSAMNDVSVQAPEPNAVAILAMSGLLVAGLRRRRRGHSL